MASTRQPTQPASHTAATGSLQAEARPSATADGRLSLVLEPSARSRSGRRGETGMRTDLAVATAPTPVARLASTGESGVASERDLACFSDAHSSDQRRRCSEVEEADSDDGSLSRCWLELSPDLWSTAHRSGKGKNGSGEERKICKTRPPLHASDKAESAAAA